ncbi:MAG: DUF4160 domain-containing protein [Gallionella sp.]|nr:DUF4160 domain-containing protein [Gallionella sp.]
MPTISMFFGILIRMYFFDDKQHHAPHIHAECQGQQAVYLIETGERISGNMPPNKEKLIQAWMVSTRMSCLPIGLWPLKAKSLSASNRCARK